MRRFQLAVLHNKHHIAFALALIISLKLLFTEDSQDLDIIRKKANDVFMVLYSPIAWVRSLITVQEENALLRGKNIQLALQIESMEHLADENERLEQLLDFRRESQLTLLPAKVVSKGVAPNLTSISIDVGSQRGVQQNDPVLTPTGVVGKTVLVSEHSSIVQLLSDLNFRLSIRIMPSGVTGILRWREGNICEIREVPKTGEIQVGNKIVTSGFSDIYPEFLPVGEVIGTLDVRGSFQKIVTAKIFNDLGSLINVFVITGQKNEMD